MDRSEGQIRPPGHQLIVTDIVDVKCNMSQCSTISPSVQSECVLSLCGSYVTLVWAGSHVSVELQFYGAALHMLLHHFLSRRVAAGSAHTDTDGVFCAPSVTP